MVKFQTGDVTASKHNMFGASAELKVLAVEEEVNEETTYIVTPMDHGGYKVRVAEGDLEQYLR